MTVDILFNVLSFKVLLICATGTMLGIVLGAIPGMNAGIGVAVVLPFTYAMEPAMALLFLGGLYMGSGYGGSISGILINVPGTVESACTTIEGYPLARTGKGRQALYYSLISSTVGGCVGLLALIFFTPTLAKVSVRFGPPEMFLVALCGLAIVGSLTGKNLFKGLFAALFGLFLGMIGIDDVTGISRFTFGLKPLIGGVQLIPAVIGFFALAEMTRQAVRLRESRQASEAVHLEKAKLRSVLREVFVRHWKILAKSSIIATIIGVIPGTGGAIASFVAYGEAKRTSKTPGLFGKGNPEGIVAAESANNAAVGGALVPMLSLGIPGSSTTAIMYGALLIHGLVPGPRLFTEHANIAYTFLIGMLLTVGFMMILGFYGVNLWSQILKIKMIYVIPAVIACSLLGAYSVRNSINDVLVAVACGAIGVLFSRIEVPTPPIVLGLILGTLLEQNLMRTIIMASAKRVSLIRFTMSRPMSIAIVALTLLLIVTTARVTMKQRQIARDISDPSGSETSKVG